jgi:hypothetical protein
MRRPKTRSLSPAPDQPPNGVGLFSDNHITCRRALSHCDNDFTLGGYEKKCTTSALKNKVRSHTAQNSDIISARESGARNLGRVGNNRLRCCPYSGWLFATQTEKTLTIVPSDGSRIFGNHDGIKMHPYRPTPSQVRSPLRAWTSNPHAVKTCTRSIARP